MRSLCDGRDDWIRIWGFFDSLLCSVRKPNIVTKQLKLYRLLADSKPIDVFFTFTPLFLK